MNTVVSAVVIGVSLTTAVAALVGLVYITFTK